MGFKGELSLFDVTSIVVGSIVGADIYIASAITAGMLGPFSLVIWVIAGIFATIIALVFAYCSYYVPKVGGPFAFVSEAFDDFYGFLTGWSMWIAEVISLPVFAIAFVRYLEFLVPLNSWEEIVIKGIFLFILTLVNIIGVKVAGRVNDVLTLIKIIPLLLLMGAGTVFLVSKPDVFFSNYHPFIPLGISATGTALVLIFWACRIRAGDPAGYRGKKSAGYDPEGNYYRDVPCRRILCINKFYRLWFSELDGSYNIIHSPHPGRGSPARRGRHTDYDRRGAILGFRV